MTEKKPDGTGGKAIPLDIGTRTDGNLTVVGQTSTTRGVSPVVRSVAKGEGDRVTHYATCPGAKAFRRG